MLKRTTIAAVATVFLAGLSGATVASEDRGSSRRTVAPASLDGAMLIGAFHLCLTWVKLSRLWAGKLGGVATH